MATWVERDPIPTLLGRLQADGALSDGDWAAMQQEVDAEMEKAVAYAEAGTPEPVEELTRFVYSERSGHGQVAS